MMELRSILNLLKRLGLGLLGLIAFGLLYDVCTRPGYDGNADPSTEGLSARRSTTPFDGSTFYSESYAAKKPTDILKWGLNRQQGPWEKRPNRVAENSADREWDGMRITLINHATVLIQTRGINLLTDPIWSKAAGPFGRFGPTRFREPGIAFDELPKIDAVFVSHSHFDHMDLPTLARLNTRDQPTFVVGLGNSDNLAKVGIDRALVKERNWWQSVDLGNDLRLMMTPARHWSKRSVLDSNRTLWGSFVLMHDDKALVYFAGDTGYGTHFDEIARELGPTRVALMPIGAYLPRWFMKDNHLSPGEAYRAAMELQADTMIPIHYGTFALGDDGQDEPLADLLETRNAYSSDLLELRVLDNGQHIDLPLRKTQRD